MENQPTGVPSDDELLANAIPIDQALQDQEIDPTPDPIVIKQTQPASPVGSSKIRAFGSSQRQQYQWRRTPNTTGQGATHVRTFISKLRPGAIDLLDQQVNQWLDEHPDYEVKLVTTTIGELSDKVKEPALFMNVWV